MTTMTATVMASCASCEITSPSFSMDDGLVTVTNTTRAVLMTA